MVGFFGGIHMKFQGCKLTEDEETYGWIVFKGLFKSSPPWQMGFRDPF